MSDEKPKWECVIPLENFRWLYGATIVQIMHHRRLYDTDKSENWIVLTRADGNEKRFDSDFFESQQSFEFRPDYSGLVHLSYVGERHEKRMKEITEFNQKHSRELATLKRLKEKYETT